jgi:tetratricopeptide (TPR) repeat protein
MCALKAMDHELMSMKQPLPALGRQMKLSRDFQQAVLWHKQGELKRAEQLYRNILKMQANHFEASYLLGLLLHGLGRNEDALRHIGRALKINPKHVAALMSLGLVHAALSRFGEALTCYEKVLVLKPDYPEAHNNRGNMLARLKRFDEALASYEQAIALSPHLAELHNNLGNALRELGRFPDALACYDKAIALNPNYISALNNRGNVLRNLKRPEEALACYDRGLVLKPDLAEMHNNRGNALADLSQFNEACESFDRAIALNGNFVSALNNRGNVLRNLRRLDEALANYDRAIALDPGLEEVHNNRGNVLRDLARPEEGLASYDRAIALRPDYAQALSNRGNALIDLKRFEEARASCEKALALNSNSAEVHNGLGNALRELNRPDEALAHYERAIALNPYLADAHNNCANALRDLNRPEEALASYEKAIALKEDYAEAYSNKGLVLVEIGRLKEARDVIETAIKLAPENLRAYYNLTQCTRLRADDPHMRAMEEMAQSGASMPIGAQIDLSFALGKAFADIGDPERSFEYLLQGNRLKRKQISYDEAHALNAIERSRLAFTGEVLQRNSGRGALSSSPIFVFGMPRSGTTLIEQILASHPKVFGAGEINDFETSLIEHGGLLPIIESLEATRSISGDVLHQLGTHYVDRIRKIAPSAEHIVNKALNNFLFAGLIHLALPNARMIHLSRDPVDTCLSCFSRQFTGHLPYSWDLGELGRYYRAYARIMEHWDNVLPPDRLLDVRYEEVVADLDGQARRIIAYCGLEWDARCLDFHRTERPVRTASATQVREPIYAHSVGRWRAYQPFLGPLLDELYSDRSSEPPSYADEVRVSREVVNGEPPRG